MSKSVKVASLSDLPEGSSREVAVEGRIVALFHVEGRIHALDGICPHAGGPLGEGTLAQGVVTCPWHGWQFNVANGHHCLNGNICQQTFSVQIDGDDVLVNIP